MPVEGRVARVAIVEDHVLFAEALSAALQVEGYEVDHVPLDDSPIRPDHLLARAVRQRPTVVLLDLDLGHGGDACTLVRPLHRSGTQVVVLTGCADPARWGECLRYGAKTVLPKTTSLASILSTLSDIVDHRPLPGAEERNRLIAESHREEARQRDGKRRLDSLTPREREVLGHLMAGHSVRDIARRSFVSEDTVRSQVKSILAKLGVTSQIAAVGLAHSARWTPPRLPDTR